MLQTLNFLRGPSSASHLLPGTGKGGYLGGNRKGRQVQCQFTLPHPRPAFTGGMPAHFIPRPGPFLSFMSHSSFCKRGGCSLLWSSLSKRCCTWPAPCWGLSPYHQTENSFSHLTTRVQQGENLLCVFQSSGFWRFGSTPNKLWEDKSGELTPTWATVYKGKYHCFSQ